MKIPSFVSLFLLFAAACTALADWRSDAEARIEEHRTSEVTLELIGPGGDPLPAGTEVRVRMTRSAFNWSVATGAGALGRWYSGDEYYTQYYDQLPLLANTTEATSAHQWWMTLQDNWQRVEQRFVAWSRLRGLAFRGHNMFWAKDLPNFVVPEPYYTWFMEETPGKQDEFRAAVEHHIQWIGERTPFVYEWDVVNEPIAEAKAFRYLGYDSLAEQGGLIAEWLNLARQSAPQARLVVNEFGIIHNNATNKNNRYFQLCDEILKAGGALDGVGFQLHYWNGNQRMHPEQVYERIDAYAQLGLTISVTEYDTYGGGWDSPSPWHDPGTPLTSDEVKGLWFEDILLTFYSHPACTTFQTWMKSDPLGNSGVFFDEDFNPKPQHAAWQKLVLGAWSTDETLAVDASGDVALRAHHGEYEVTANVGGEDLSATVTIGPDSETLPVALANDRAPEIVSDVIRPALKNLRFYGAVVVEGGDPPLTYTMSGAPGWLSLGASGTDAGMLTGAASQTGTHTFDVTVTDADGDTDTRTFTLTVGPGVLRVITQDLPAGSEGVPYAATVQAFGEDTPFTWSKTSGPDWLQVDANGQLTGTPPQEGDFSVTLQVTDGDGDTDSLGYELTVLPAAGSAEFAEDGGRVVMEAENATGSTSGSGALAGVDWALVTDGNAGGGLALAPDPDTGANAGDTPDGSPRLDFSIDFATAGAWYLWARWDAPGGANDSVHFGLNGTALSAAPGSRGLTSSTNGYEWVNFYDGGRATIQIATPGTHVLNIWMREDGLQLDRLLLTTDPAFTPVGYGPAETRAPEEPSPPHVEVSPTEGDGLILEFTTVPGMTYQLRTSDSLHSPWVPLEPDQTLTGDGSRRSFEIAPPLLDLGNGVFYIIEYGAAGL